MSGSPPGAAARRSSEARGGRLLKILGVGFGLAVILGNTIGAGILRAPGEVAGYLPNAWLCMGLWATGGLYSLLGAVSVAELGAMLPRSGGQYVFARAALGEYAGFVVGWSDWISTCGSAAAVSIIMGEYTGVLIPSLRGNTVLIGSLVAILFAVLQWRGILLGSRIQDVTSLLKALAFVALIAACFLFGGRGAEAGAPLAEAPPAQGPLVVGIVLSLQIVLYTYDGWTGVLYFSEEVRAPERDIPRALFGGVLSVLGIYMLVNLALLHVLPISSLAGDKLAASQAAKVIFGAHGEGVIRGLTIVSLLSSINALHLMATRVLFAMSRDGLLSPRVSRVNEGGTPTFALFASAAMAVLFILSGTFEKVVAVLSFFFVANYAVSFISVFVLRKREPERPRPYRVWGYPWTTALALTGSIAFLIGAIVSDTKTSLYALLLLAVSYPAYRLSLRLSRG